MYYLCVLAGEKMKVKIENINEDLLLNLTIAGVPWYICDSANRLLKKQNCDNKSISSAKTKTMNIKKHRIYYALVCTWWAGHRVLATYSSKEAALRHLSTRQSTYQGNGVITCEEMKEEQYVPISEEVLKSIIDSYDGMHHDLHFTWTPIE